MKKQITKKQKPKKRKTREQKIKAQQRLKRAQLENSKKKLEETLKAYHDKNSELRKSYNKKINPLFPCLLGLTITASFGSMTQLNPFKKSPYVKNAVKDIEYQNGIYKESGPYFDDAKKDNLKVSYIIASEPNEQKGYSNYGTYQTHKKNCEDILKLAQEQDEEALFTLLNNKKMKKFYTDSIRSLGLNIEGTITDSETRITEYCYNPISKMVRLGLLYGCSFIFLFITECDLIFIIEANKQKKLRQQMNELMKKERESRRLIRKLEEEK